MKKKNLALTKRVVSFITAACLSLSSTVMVLPASAYTGETKPEKADINGQCLEENCSGTYVWAADESDNHVLKCNGEKQHTADGTSHDAGSKQDSECTLCAAMPDVTITSLSKDGYSIKVTCGDTEITSGKKIASGSTLTLAITGDNASNYNVKWSITGGGAESGNLSASTSEGTTTVAGVVSDITISATLTEKESVGGPETNDEKCKVTFTGTSTNGSYTVKCNDANLNPDTESLTVAKDAEITIVPVANDGYEVDTVKVNEIEVTADDSGAYKYTVTADITSITVTFIAKEYTVTLTPTTTNDGCTFTVTKGENETVSTGSKVTVEDTLTLSASAAEGYTFKQWTVTNATIQGDGGDGKVTDANITIKPNGKDDVTISAEFVEITTYAVTIATATNGTVTATYGEAQSVASGTTKLAKGTHVTITAKPSTTNQEKTYVVDEVKVTKDSVEGSADVAVTTNQDGTYTFEMPENAVTITVTFKEQHQTPTTYTVTADDSFTGGTIALDGNATNFAEGSTVTFTVTANENYQLKANSVKVLKTEDDADTNITPSLSDGKYTFTMPNYAVTITAEFEEKAPETYTVTTTKSGVNDADQNDVTVTVKSGENGDTAIPEAGVEEGTKITVTANSGDKYTVKSVTYSVESAQATTVTAGEDGKYTFTMPAGNVTVTVTFEKVAAKYNVTVDSTVTKGTIAATDGSSFTNVVEKTVVKFTVTPSDGYTLETGSVKVMNGETEVVVTAPTTENNYYSFVMPAANVTITAAFLDKVEWTDNGDGTYTLTTVSGSAGESYPSLLIPVSGLLKNVVTADDVVSLSFDYKIEAGFVKGGWGTTTGNNYAWVSGAAYPKYEDDENTAVSTGTVVLDLDGAKLNASNVTVNVDWANENSKIIISNIKANTAEYSVTVAESENGTVEAPAKAQYGDEVTLTVKPAKNYVLKTLTVTYKTSDDAAPAAVTVNDNKFTMPKGNVTVTAEFEAISSIFTVKIDGKASTNKLDTWADVLSYINTNGGEDKEIFVTVNGEAEFTGTLPAAKKAKVLVIDGKGTLTFAKKVSSIKVNSDTAFGVKLALSENAKKVNVNVPAGKMFVLQRVDCSNIFGKVSGTKTSTFAVGYSATVDQISTFGEVNAGEGSITVNGNVSDVANFNGNITLVNSLTGTKATTAAIDNVTTYTSSIKIVANEKGVLPKLTVASVKAPNKETGRSAKITVVNAAGEAVDLTSGTIVAYTKGADIAENITIGNMSGENGLKAFYYSKTKAVKAEIATAMTVKKTGETTGKDYPNLDLALASMTENANYTLTLNANASVANLVMPKNITGLTINANADTGAKLIITGTKLNVTKDLNLDLPVQVEKGNTNKTGKIDITVAKGMMLYFGTNFDGDVINKITGTNTSVLAAAYLKASQISTFKDIECSIIHVTGNVSNVTNFYGVLVVEGAKSKINITNVIENSSIVLCQDEKGAVPALTVSDIVGISGSNNVNTQTGKLTIGVVDLSLSDDVLSEDAIVTLTPGTTVATIKAVAKGTPAEDVVKKISIANEDSKGNTLTANYYSKTKTVKAEYNDAIFVYYGDVKEKTTPAAKVPNLDKALEEIAKQTTAQDVTLKINSDITAAANFALPKKNVTKLTLTGEGSITFLGTKLAVPYDTKLDVKVFANNKAKALDLTVSSTKTKPVELTITENTLDSVNGTNAFGRVTGNTGAALTVDNSYGYSGSVKFKGISKFDTVTGGIKVTGNVANVGVFSGVLDVYGAKTTVGIGEIKNYEFDYGTQSTNHNSGIYLIEESNTLPKVTITSIEKESGLVLRVDDESGNTINLESGRTVLYTKDNKFADAAKITILNNFVDYESPTMTASYDAKTKTIKAVDALAVSLLKYDDVEDKFVDVKEGEGENAKAVSRQSLEEIVAIIDGFKDTEAVYEIVIDSSIEVAKLALPTKAARVVIMGNDNVVINIGKTASITAPTDIELNNVLFKTTAKTLTLNAKKSVYVIDNTTIDVFKGTKGNKRLNEEHFMKVLGWSEDEDGFDFDRYDVSGFDTLYVGEERPENNEGNTDSNYGSVEINTTLDVTKLVLEEDSDISVYGTLKKGQFTEFVSGKNAAIYYEEMGKTTLKFAGKNADAFKVDAGGLKIYADYGTKLLTTKVLKDLSIFKDDRYEYAESKDTDIKPCFTQVGNDIVYLRESFGLSVTKADGTKEIGNFGRWDDVVAKIAELNDKTADYTITLHEGLGYSSAAAIKFPKVKTYNSLTISGGNGMTGLLFTGSLTLTGNTTFKNVYLGSVKLVKGVYQAVNYSISANAYDVVFDSSYAQKATINAKNLTVKNCNFDVEKITVKETLTTNCGDSNYIDANKGVQTKNWVLESNTQLYLGLKSTVKVTGELSLAKQASGKLNVTACDKDGNPATTFAKNYSIGSVKKGYELVTLGNEGYKLDINAKTGAIKVVSAGDSASVWTVTSDKIVFNGILGNTTDDNNQYGGEDGSFPIAGLLPSGKTLSQVKSVTCDIKFVNGWGGGCMGINNGNTSKNTWGEWTTGNWENPKNATTSNCTINLGNYGVGGSENITIQIWWAGANSGDAKIEFSNFKFNF